MKSSPPGRNIWQLADADRLLLAWRARRRRRGDGARMRSPLADFMAPHDGQRPLANLTG